jgi:two-component system, sensor histidine kinase and response regulator
MNKYSSVKVLIVDDEPANVFLLEGLLAEEGFIVNSCTNSKEALEKIKVLMPDVILLDIMMPEVTGITLLEIIKSDVSISDIPVIMVTAKSEAEDVEEALSKGAVEYIKKPINEIELLARLRTILRLKQQEDYLKNLLKSKEEFIRMVSHDVRAPFTSIVGFADMLLNDKELSQKLNSEQKEFLTIIIDTTNFIIDYFNKLLNWSNMGAKELVLQKENVFIEKLIQTSKVIYQSKMENKKIDLVIDIKNDLQINVDLIYFNQVINNLLSNAIKFTPEGGRITISAKKEQDLVIFSIADTGVGIINLTPDELFGTSFHKSTRGTNGEKGSGLGLRICKMILDAHGFGFNFYSKPNEETRFIIEIKTE